MSAELDGAGYELVFTCDRCESDYRPSSGECPECGDWAFTATIGPAPPVLATHAIGGA